MPFFACGGIPFRTAGSHGRYMENKGKKIFGLLAEMLDYPTHRIAAQAREAAPTLELANPATKPHIDRFLDFCHSNPLSRLEEIYIETFDLQAACCPYVGHHLFAEDRSRSLFVVRMREHYGSHVSYRNELPDHITIMLRSLVVQDSVEEARDLIFLCLVPALRKMIALLIGSSNPYREVMIAVLLTLETEGDAPN